MHDTQQQLGPLLEALGITPAILARKALPLHPPAQQLVVAETDACGRQYLLVPEAARAWASMRQAAWQQGVALEIVSAFRSIERQADIIRTKLAQGLAIEHILTLSAAPGYSEHHTGCAIDINTPGCAATEEAFEHTQAYAWLCANAAAYGYALSYPRGNALGFIYEPWHWCYHPGTRTRWDA